MMGQSNTTMKQEYRILRAKKALNSYQDSDEPIKDFLTDLCHAVGVGGVLDALKSAALHHEAETHTTEDDPHGVAAGTRYIAIGQLAKDHLEDEGALEIDDHPMLSEDEETNGCYVLAWAWLSFSGTHFDKD